MHNDLRIRAEICTAEKIKCTCEYKFLYLFNWNSSNFLQKSSSIVPYISVVSCKFVHAACMYDGLSAAYMGQCTSTTVPPPSVSSGNAAGSTAAGSTPAATTVGPGSSPSTAPPTTTLSPETIAFQNVFCRNKDSINCPTVVTPLCGSDGVVYDSR